MFNISVEKKPGCMFILKPMSVKRDWMDKTSEKHAYKCLPVTLANAVGWSLSCSEDIVFTWDGINDQTAEHVKISSPASAYSGRGQSTISLNTGLVFKTDNNVSLWIINPVNYFSEDFETMSSLISTSFYDYPLPLAIKAKRINEETVIKAQTPICSIIPISLSNLNDTSIVIREYYDKDDLRNKAIRDYGIAAQEINARGEWTDWYRDAVNEKQEVLGVHELKTLRLSVEDKSGEGL